eukprot:CAMPEP_0206534698 /NCGR_PEP_ID=MMETSP0325_2-20121206/5695_1 /ASSEMBLY_ACC=CAM_ASM_000347 /TAXON_ID=2866 /ORGANISM="Crypthecodinium cohnii, Strain Seligo" /LENGTH=506 /DNA_ID=CAMNT_0054031541 /DNA_START=258 /DNA_END=1779 /DNA_ORIENTATION=-
MERFSAPASHSSQLWNRFGQAPHYEPSGARTPDFVHVYRTDYDLKSFAHRLPPASVDSPDQFLGYTGDYNNCSNNAGFYPSVGAETPRGHYLPKDFQTELLLQRLRAVEYEQTQDPESSSSGGSWSQEGLPTSPIPHKQQQQQQQQQHNQHQSMLPPPPPPPPVHRQQYRPALNLEGLYQNNDSLLSRGMGMGAEPLPVGLVRQELPLQVSPPLSPHIPMTQLFRAPPGLALDMTAQDSLNSSGESTCVPAPPPPAPHAEARPAKRQPVVISMGTVGHPTTCADALRVPVLLDGTSLHEVPPLRRGDSPERKPGPGRRSGGAELPQRRQHEPPPQLRGPLQVRGQAQGLQGRNLVHSMPFVPLEAVPRQEVGVPDMAAPLIFCRVAWRLTSKQPSSSVSSQLLTLTFKRNLPKLLEIAEGWFDSPLHPPPLPTTSPSLPVLLAMLINPPPPPPHPPRPPLSWQQRLFPDEQKRLSNSPPRLPSPPHKTCEARLFLKPPPPEPLSEE